jgi:pyrroloquinoline quinone (PQQ) biosynthesis protein C
MDVLASLETTRQAINVLDHPFYRRWSAGELSAGELARYAGEYGHAVEALARASEHAAAKAAPARRDALSRHAAEETAHVELWERFARAAGAGPAAERPEPLPETRECVRAWSAGEDLLEHLAVLYVIEGGQPEISRTKLEGLTAHYGFSEEGPAGEYFRVHRLLDVEHARQAGELIEELMAEGEDPGAAERMERRATAALRGNWSLLDAVQSQAATVAG